MTNVLAASRPHHTALLIAHASSPASRASSTSTPLSASSTSRYFPEMHLGVSSSWQEQPSRGNYSGLDELQFIIPGCMPAQPSTTGWSYEETQGVAYVACGIKPRAHDASRLTYRTPSHPGNPQWLSTVPWYQDTVAEQQPCSQSQTYPQNTPQPASPQQYFAYIQAPPRTCLSAQSFQQQQPANCILQQTPSQSGFQSFPISSSPSTYTAYAPVTQRFVIQQQD
jgi:hypothetical protein